MFNDWQGVIESKRDFLDSLGHALMSREVQIAAIVMAVVATVFLISGFVHRAKARGVRPATYGGWEVFGCSMTVVLGTAGLVAVSALSPSIATATTKTQTVHAWVAHVSTDEVTGVKVYHPFGISSIKGTAYKHAVVSIGGTRYKVRTRDDFRTGDRKYAACLHTTNDVLPSCVFVDDSSTRQELFDKLESSFPLDQDNIQVTWERNGLVR